MPPTLARRHGFTDILGRAGLEAAAAKTAGIGFEFGVVDEPLARLLEEALAVETDVARRVQLLSTLAITRYYDPDPVTSAPVRRRGHHPRGGHGRRAPAVRPP